MEKDFSAFERKINIKFKNPDLLMQAFTHRSFLNENKGWKLDHNERLEFLGDAVLELVVSEFLFEKYPKKPEGQLTSLRAALVNTNSISEAATNLGANDFLLLSKGEAKDTGKARQFILANTFEAIIGAIYLDQGYDVAKKFIGENILHKTEKIISENLWQDAKSFFQEKAQEKEGITPHYDVLSEVGPDHEREFTVGVFLGKEKIAQGKGMSKQTAEQSAAQAGLEKKGWK